jgi:hypothetical protein
MLTELCVASGASVKRPVATAPLATNVTIVIVTGVAILPRKIFLRLAFNPALELRLRVHSLESWKNGVVNGVVDPACNSSRPFEQDTSAIFVEIF